MFSVDDWLQRRCLHFHGNMVMDELYGEDETPFAANPCSKEGDCAEDTFVIRDPVTHGVEERSPA